ncbi:MAG: hypothetical protein ACFE8P_11260 [Promethearchaeota archaeon]
MKGAAFFAFVKFKKVQFAQLSYGSDDVLGEEWDRMSLGENIPLREKIFLSVAVPYLRP